jgi:hypothetical protein
MSGHDSGSIRELPPARRVVSVEIVTPFLIKATCLSDFAIYRVYYRVK